MLLGSGDKAVTLTSPGANLDSAELALASSVAVLTQTVLLLGSCVLLGGHNASVLVENQLRLGKTTGGLVGSSVPHLGARPLKHLVFLSVHVVKTIITSVATFHHFTKSVVINYC